MVFAGLQEDFYQGGNIIRHRNGVEEKLKYNSIKWFCQEKNISRNNLTFAWLFIILISLTNLFPYVYTRSWRCFDAPYPIIHPAEQANNVPEGNERVHGTPHGQFYYLQF